MRTLKEVDALRDRLLSDGTPKKECDNMVNIIKVGSGYVSSKHKTFLIDSEDDVARLPRTTGADPCAPGSIAYTPDLTVVYILGNDGYWHNAIITPGSDGE